MFTIGRRRIWLSGIAKLQPRLQLLAIDRVNPLGLQEDRRRIAYNRRRERSLATVRGALGMIFP